MRNFQCTTGNKTKAIQQKNIGKGMHLPVSEGALALQISQRLGSIIDGMELARRFCHFECFLQEKDIIGAVVGDQNVKRHIRLSKLLTIIRLNNPANEGLTLWQKRRALVLPTGLGNGFKL